MCLRQLQKLGHTPIVSWWWYNINWRSFGKRKVKILSEKEIEKNVRNIKFTNFLSTKGKNKVVFVNNKDWLKKLKL